MEAYGIQSHRSHILGISYAYRFRYFSARNVLFFRCYLGWEIREFNPNGHISLEFIAIVDLSIFGAGCFLLSMLLFGGGVGNSTPMST